MNLRQLVDDIRAAGIPYEPEIDRLPFLVREHAALITALGHAVIMDEEAGRDLAGDLRPVIARQRVLRALRLRIMEGLRAIEAMGRRSRFASWFEDR